PCPAAIFWKWIILPRLLAEQHKESRNQLGSRLHLRAVSLYHSPYFPMPSQVHYIHHTWYLMVLPTYTICHGSKKVVLASILPDHVVNGSAPIGRGEHRVPIP